MDCHITGQVILDQKQANLALIGQQNVGKSAIFQRLTNRQTIVANYPGTTVELLKGTLPEPYGSTLIDTPGLHSLPAHTEDERVTTRLLLEGSVHGIIQVGDGKNLRRTLLLTLQLMEMGLPLAVALNMKDEADRSGMEIDHRSLERELGIPFIPTTATRGEGLTQLLEAVNTRPTASQKIKYPEDIEQAINNLQTSLPEMPISSRSLILLWLSGDKEAEAWFREHLSSDRLAQFRKVRDQLNSHFTEPLPNVLQSVRLDYLEALIETALRESPTRPDTLAQSLARLAVHEIWGFPILILVLLGLYLFVGTFGAGILVDFLETTLFGTWINPWVERLVTSLSPVPWITQFLVGPYGIWSMGVTYSVALILPIVSTFFLAFGVLEDSGYLPRVAVVSNRLFQRLGLNGKAVLPMVLGLGCVTMATLTTRTLESRRDRLLVTLLLALGVPCSAQLGVVMGMLGGISFFAVLLWAGLVFGVIFLVGKLAAYLIPGKRSLLMVELPPMRLPSPENLALKTLARVEWYLKEVVPIFLLGAAALFLLEASGLLPLLTEAGKPLVTGWLGLPPETSTAFVMGFLRRDFGATGLFVMNSNGLLTTNQVLTAMITITLFIPCIASVFMILREQGWRRATAMVVLIFPLAFLVGGLVHRLLPILG